jgi:uncharacterized protein (TIGR02466 family)
MFATWQPIWLGAGAMTIRSLFSTPFYAAELGNTALVAELDASIRGLARDDKAGQGWCKTYNYPGYTSYASLNDLVHRDPAFDDLARALAPHISAFAKACHWDLAKKPKLDSLWVNMLKPGGGHSGHIHPHSIISGTVYIAVPPGSGALKLEDPRLPMLMAAPTRLPSAPPEGGPFYYAQPAVGQVFLWESWLRHEVSPSTAKSDRLSISFNYR